MNAILISPFVNINFAFALFIGLSSCAPNSRVEKPERRLVDITVERTDLSHFAREDSIASSAKPPFSPSTRIIFSVSNKDSVEINMYDTEGIPVSRTFQAFLDSADYLVKLDGNLLQSGVYFFRIRVGREVQTKKSIFLK